MIKLITSNQNLCTLRQSRDLIYLFAGRPHHYSTVSYSICALLAPQSALLHRTIRIVPEERHDRRSSGTIRRAPVALKSAGRSAGHVPALLRDHHCILDYLPAVVYKLYNSIASTSNNSIVPASWRIHSVQCIRSTTSTAAYPNTCENRRALYLRAELAKWPPPLQPRFLAAAVAELAVFQHGYRMQVQSIMEERHWAYLALFPEN